MEAKLFCASVGIADGLFLSSEFLLVAHWTAGMNWSAGR